MKDLIIDLLEKNHTKKEISNILNIGYSTVIRSIVHSSSTSMSMFRLWRDRSKIVLWQDEKPLQGLP